MTLQNYLNGLLIIILAGVLLGAYGVQFIYQEEPCPLCMLQRIAMIGVASAAMLNLKFGIRMAHYALMLVTSIFGAFVAMRQISLHICPGFPTFGFPVLGLSLYTWSFLVFLSVIFGVAILLFLYDFCEKEEKATPLNGFNKFACGLIFCVTLANIITTFLQCGWGACS